MKACQVNLLLSFTLRIRGSSLPFPTPTVPPVALSESPSSTPQIRTKLHQFSHGHPPITLFNFFLVQQRRYMLTMLQIPGGTSAASGTLIHYNARQVFLLLQRVAAA